MTSPSPLPSHIWFDPQFRAKDAELSAAIKSLGRYLESKEADLGFRSRSRTVSAKKSFNVAVEAICCNLLITRLANRTALALPLAHNSMWGRGRYGNPVYGQHFRDVIGILVELGLIDRLTKGYHVSKKTKAPSLFRATALLAEHLPVDQMNWRSIRREPDRELIFLKAGKDEDGNAEPIDYRESRQIKLWRGQVARINEWLASADIDVVDDCGSPVLGEGGLPVAAFRRSLRRIFNNKSWQDGGRLWGGFWMNMKGEDRPRIRINGEPIEEVDYLQLYPRLAYARAQAEIPDGDFYDIAGDGSSRAGWKILMNAMLFAERPLGNWPKDTQGYFPEGMKLREAVGLVERKHQPIAHLFGSRLGFQLMRMESDILISAVTILFKMGVPALPLHDAVLVARSQAEVAKEVLEYELERWTEQRCATVKIKVRPN